MKHERFVSVCLDVEDPINPLADDAAREVAELVTNAGVRGSFCVTGEKCRKLVERGRSDVIEALKVHSLGLHTDTHSFHPTTMELLADTVYEVGTAIALIAERRGRDSFVSAFGRTPSYWGGAGNTWAPEIPFALSKLGIQGYVYALTELPGNRCHRFNGVFAMAQHFEISELDWADDARASACGEKVLAQLASGYQCVFVGHPTKFRHKRYWDTPFNAGVTPDPVPLAEPWPLDTYRRSLDNLAKFLRRLSVEAVVIGVDEAMELPWQFRDPTFDERTFFAQRTAENLRGAARWPIHHPDLDPSHIVSKTLALIDTLEVAELV